MRFEEYRQDKDLRWTLEWGVLDLTWCTMASFDCCWLCRSPEKHLDKALSSSGFRQTLLSLEVPIALNSDWTGRAVIQRRKVIFETGLLLKECGYAMQTPFIAENWSIREDKTTLFRQQNRMPITGRTTGLMTSIERLLSLRGTIKKMYCQLGPTAIERFSRSQAKKSILAMDNGVWCLSQL